MPDLSDHTLRIIFLVAVGFILAVAVYHMDRTFHED
jgi:hypothetical protein